VGPFFVPEIAFVVYRLQPVASKSSSLSTADFLEPGSKCP